MNENRENEEKIMELLKSISKDGKCVIIVTHSNSVKKYSDIKLNITNKHIYGNINLYIAFLGRNFGVNSMFYIFISPRNFIF